MSREPATKPTAEPTAPEPPLDHPRLDDVDLTSVLSALAEPARLTILRTVASLSDGESACLDVWERSGLAATKSTMSHHYKVMREAGLVHMRYVGSRKYVRIRREEMDARWPGLLNAVLKDEPEHPAQ